MVQNNFSSIHCDGNYISNLHAYKSSSVDNSITRSFILKPFLYEPLVHFFPKTLHPNIVTILGAMAIFAQVLICVVFSESMSLMGVPSWVFIVAALLLFTYQTFDNLDGMQARRTGTSSALGELYDHGIDALVTGLCSFAWMSVVGRGISIYSFLACLPPALAFIGATWQEYYDSSLVFGYINGPNEGLLLVMSSFLMTGICGHENIHLPIRQLLGQMRMEDVAKFLGNALDVTPFKFLGLFSNDFSHVITSTVNSSVAPSTETMSTIYADPNFTSGALKGWRGIVSILAHWNLNMVLDSSVIHLGICFTLLLAILTVLNHLLHVFVKRPSQFLQNIQTLFPYVVEMMCTYLWIASSEMNAVTPGSDFGIPAKYPVLFWLNHVILFAYLGSQITLAFVLKAPLARFFWILVPYVVGTLNAYYHFIPISEVYLFIGVFCWSAVNYIIFVLDVSFTVSSVLDIGILRLNSRQLKHMQEMERLQKEAKNR